ncbi:MAG: RpiB/LacA/LacB family sugar-phosphate isomerase [bacterium]|nr:RpiB/LacA/LacB family sugar-phosphate isomerase [bacterium]
MKIFLGADHKGWKIKEGLELYLKDEGYDVVDVGDKELNPNDDFPKYSAKVAVGVLSEKDAKGIVLCGSGQGVCIAANRFKGIRASLVWNKYEAHSSRNDDDANVLCLPSHEMDFDKAKELVDVWLSTQFESVSRRIRRIKQLDELN